MDNVLLAVGSFAMGCAFWGLLHLLPWRLQMPFYPKTPAELAEDHANGAHDKSWLLPDGIKACPKCVNEAQETG